MFLEISQIWQENTCARVSFLIKLQDEACKFIKKETPVQLFCLTSANNCCGLVWMLQAQYVGSLYFIFSIKIILSIMKYFFLLFKVVYVWLSTILAWMYANSLTHWRPMFPFHVPWKHQKTKKKWCFQGVQNENIRWV